MTVDREPLALTPTLTEAPTTDEEPQARLASDLTLEEIQAIVGGRINRHTMTACIDWAPSSAAPSATRLGLKPKNHRYPYLDERSDLELYIRDFAERNRTRVVEDFGAVIDPIGGYVALVSPSYDAEHYRKTGENQLRVIFITKGGIMPVVSLPERAVAPAFRLAREMASGS